MGDKSNETIRTTLAKFKKKLNDGELDEDPPPAENRSITDTFITYINSIDNRVSEKYATEIGDLRNEFKNTKTKYVYDDTRKQSLIDKIDAILNKLDISKDAVPITRTRGKNQQPPAPQSAQEFVGGKKRRSKRHKKRHKKRNRKTFKRK